MKPTLQKKSIILMILLFIITYGIYMPVWFLRQRESINKLNSKKKLSKWQPSLTLALFIISAIFSIYPLIVYGTFPEGTIDTIDFWVSFAGGILVIIMSFRVGWIMEDHFNKKLSLAGTFFLTIFYLQYKINKFL